MLRDNTYTVEALAVWVAGVGAWYSRPPRSRRSSGFQGTTRSR
jgi:hypothetical protein